MKCCRFIGMVFLAAVPSLAAQAPPADLLRKADAAYRAREIPEAVRLFEKALATDASLVPAHMMLGIIYAQQNQTGRAVKHFEAVVSVQPGNAAAHFFLAKLASSQFDWPKAASHFRSALEYGPGDRESAAIGLAAAEAHIGEPGKALARLSELPPPAGGQQLGAYYAALALAYRHLENPRQAIEALRKATAANPSDPDLREQLAEAHIAAGEYPAALTAAIDAQHKFPDHAGIQYELGIGGFYIPGSPFTSLALRNLTDLASGDARTLVLQGLSRLESEEPGAAIEALRKAAAADAPQSRLFLAIALAGSEEFRESEKILRQAGEEKLDGNFYLALGRALIGQGRYAEALSPLLKAEEYMPKNPEVHLQLSRAYGHAGESSKAAEHKQTWEHLRTAENESY